MSYNDTLRNVLIASGVKINATLDAELAEIDAEEDGGERRHIMSPAKLSEHLSQWHKVPRANPKINLPTSAPPKASRPSTGIQRGHKDGRLYDPRDQCEASKTTGGVDNTTIPIPRLIVTAPDSQRQKATGTFNPDIMDDFLSEISKWAETSQSQPAEQGDDR